MQHYGRTEGLSSDTVRNLYEDREGVVWAVTTNGIDSFTDSAVTTFSSSEGLPKDGASGVLGAQDGTVWVANAESLDHIVNGSVSSIRTGHGLPGHQVSSLLEDHSGNLWVGVDDGCTCSRMGAFGGYRKQTTNRLDLWLEWLRTLKATFGQSAAVLENSCAFTISK